MQSNVWSTACASCRLRYLLAIHQAARTSISQIRSRNLHITTRLHLRQRSVRDRPTKTRTAATSDDGLLHEDTALHARQTFGDRLPDGVLDTEAGKTYERRYGRPLKTVEELDQRAIKGKRGKEGPKVEKRQEAGWQEIAIHGASFQDAKRKWKGDSSARRAAQAFDHADLVADMNKPVDEEEQDQHDGAYERVHPLTQANRFGTNPRTLFLPKEALVDPLDALTKRIPTKTLTDAAHRIFGGVGLPYSTSTPAFAKTMQQKPIPLNVSHGRMTEMDADAFATILMPGLYASITSVLVETRKRLGTAWAESMVRKAEAGTLQILDAGGAGMGVLAVRDMLAAEWERMKEAEHTQGRSLAMALAGGKSGGAAASPPLGKATAWISAEELKERAATILQDTTFIPRMPDYVHTETARYSGKFDIIISAHTIWPIKEDWERRLHIENLWSLLRAESGVLCMLEKGVARGFEAIAAARRFLLRNRIETPGESHEVVAANPADSWESVSTYEKEPGMIIAPCTNHEECPMYHDDLKGTIKGRSTICHYEQRYIRPPYLQRVLKARDKNYEDVKFSYLSVMRGTDFRSSSRQALQDSAQAIQNEQATLDSLKGFADVAQVPSSLSLPRLYLPPLKRQGHVTMDLCTPSGTLERWTVPRSFSKQAYRDARKSTWGDLWALGAKTRVYREAKLGKHAKVVHQPKMELSKKAQKAKRRLQEKKLYQKTRNLPVSD